MVYNDIYEIDFSFMGKNIEISPIKYSFVMSDSIYDLIPKCKLFFNDSEGFYQEFLMSVEGVSIDLSFGYKNEFITNKYVINRDQLKRTLSTGKINGIIEIDLEHFYTQNQSKHIRSYTNTISNVIKKIVSFYDFTKVNINDCGCNDDWYQPYVYDLDYINEYLLPLAYSNNSQDSPFYCFIDSNNEFNFRNYMSMMNGSPQITLTHSDNNIGTLTPYSFTKVSRFRTGADRTLDMRHRKIYNYDTKGVLIKKEDYLNTYPSKDIGDIPIIGDKDNYTGVIELYDDESTSGLKEMNRGMKIQSIRNSFALERLFLTLPLNTQLRSGLNVNIITTTSMSSDKSKASANYAGEYLIERTYHSWDGQTNSANTQIVVSRKAIQKLNSNMFELKKNLIQKG